MVRAGEAGADQQSTWAVLTGLRRLTMTCEGLTWLAVAAGVIFRLLDYLDNRLLYRDERSLLDNLVRLQVFDFRTTLSEYQLAPPGFLVLERLMVRLPLPTVPAARLFPLACGIAAMFLFRSAALRFLSRQAAPIATGLFALNDWLLYYSSEIKQYSCDLALTLVALLLAAGPLPSPGSAPSPEAQQAGRLHHKLPLTPRRLLAFASFGVIGVWFSYPLALVLAGIGTYLIAVTVIRREWRHALGLVATGLAWVLSFAACYVVSHGILSKESFIWDWWDFAFLPLPPRSLAELKRVFWQVVNVFNSPADVLTPLGVLPSAFLALALFLGGGVALGRRWSGGLYLLLAPILFALLASAMHQYPFHGRLLIFLVPSVHLLVGEGAAASSRRGGRWLTLGLAALLLLQPVSDVLWHRLIQRHGHGTYDSHGDLRPDLLDYLDRLETGSHRL